MIFTGANTDFDKLSNLGLSYYGEHYDYSSIMHYEANEGSRNGKNTIEAKVRYLIVPDLCLIVSISHSFIH